MEDKIKWQNISAHVPTEEKLCIVMYNAQDGLKLGNVDILKANPLTGRFLTEAYAHPTGEKFNIHGLDNDVVVERYEYKHDRIPFSDVDKWAYVEDLLID